MKKVKLLFDVQLDDIGDKYLEAGSIFEVVDHWKQYEGFTSIIVNGNVEYIKTTCFEEVN